MAGDANANIFVFDDREFPGKEEAETTFVEKSSTPTGTGGRVEEAGKGTNEVEKMIDEGKMSTRTRRLVLLTHPSIPNVHYLQKDYGNSRSQGPDRMTTTPPGHGWGSCRARII
ncbi:hypothetical protein BKA82DRAFT_4014843 [Pisolithus tinctorius]|nr:hypothetical protein BKA82DRAFT_4014843 [Pisolithus tinctorius]